MKQIQLYMLPIQGTFVQYEVIMGQLKEHEMKSETNEIDLH